RRRPDRGAEGFRPGRPEGFDLPRHYRLHQSILGPDALSSAPPCPRRPAVERVATNYKKSLSMSASDLSRDDASGFAPTVANELAVRQPYQLLPGGFGRQ